MNESSLLEIAREALQLDDFSLPEISRELLNPIHLPLAWRMFFPKTVIVKGYVFLAEAVEANPPLDSWPADENEHKVYVDSFNWLVIDDLYNEHINLDDPTLNILNKMNADVIFEAWSLLLPAQYPDHNILVRVMDEAETGYGTGIGFTQSVPLDGR